MPWIARTSALCALLLAPLAHASQDELPAQLPDPLRWVDGDPDAGAVLFPETHGRVDLAIYPAYPKLGAFHFWHGRVETDLGMVRKNDRWAVHASLAMQLVADPRNIIAFRPTRSYYEAIGMFEHRLGPGALSVGYHHRCSHGMDDAVPGRILIRSGPEVAWAGRTDLGPLVLDQRHFAMVVLAGQYADDFKPRAVAGSTVQLSTRAGPVQARLAIGTALALVGDQGEASYYLMDPVGQVRIEVLPSVAASVDLQGEAFDGSVLVHAQRVLDTGFGSQQEPGWLVSVGPAFRW